MGKGNFWDAAPTVGQPAPVRAPSTPVLRPVLTLPDPHQDHAEAVQDANLGLQVQQTGISAQNSAREASNSAFQHQQSLRQDYNNDQAVKAYPSVIRDVTGALHTAPNGAGDRTLVTMYAKLMDPTTGVREGETQDVQAASPWFQAKVAELTGQLDQSGGKFSPKFRSQLRDELIRRAIMFRHGYDQARDRYAADAQAAGIDPIRVIGPHAGAPYYKDLESYSKSQREQSGAISPEMRGGLPVGTPIQFNMDKGPQGPFDRDAFLKQNFGVTPDQETTMVAFWNANRGNPRLTADDARAWYAQNGIPAPDDAGLASMVAAVKAGKQIGPIDTSEQEKAYRAKLQSRLDQQRFDPTSAAAYSDRVAQGALLGNADEIYGLQGAVGALVGNRGVGDGYVLNRDTMRLAQEQERDKQGLTGTGLEVAGGLLPAMATGNPTSVAGAARQGAMLGGLAGFGYGEGLGGSVGGAVVGGLTGGALGGAVQGGVNALATRRAAMAANPTEGAQVIGAADRLNNQFGTKIEPMPADVGGPTTRMATGAAATLPLGVGPIIKGSQAVSREAEAARDAIAALAGNPAELEATGEAALTGAQKYIKSSRAKVGALYDRARKLGGSEPISLANARAVLDQNIAELSQVPGGSPGLQRLLDLRAQLDHPWTVEGVRGMRTNLRDQWASDGLRGSDIERRMGQVIDAADNDIQDGLVAAGKANAARAYADAAAAHKERIGVIDQVLAPIIGAKGDAPRSGEQIMEAVQTATKQNNSRLGRFLASLPADDAATVRATLISRLGNASNGMQNAAGDAFSLPQFLTHWNTMTPAAKRTLFGGNLMTALDDLAKLAEGTKHAQRFENSSKTGAAVGQFATGALLGRFMAEPVTAVAGLASQYGLGKLLSSARFARWLARVPSNPNAARNYIGGLSKVAAAEPLIAADALGLQRQLRQAFGSGQGLPVLPSAPPLAAQPPASSQDAGRTETAGVPQ